MSHAEQAQPFTGRAILFLVLAGVFAFAVFAVLSTYAPDLNAGRDGRAHALSRSAVGYAGLAALVRASGTPVVVSRSPRPPAMDRRGLRILTPDISTDSMTLAETLDKGVFEGVSLVVLPKWRIAPSDRRRGWVDQMGLIPADALAQNVRLSNRAFAVSRAAGRVPLVVQGDLAGDLAHRSLAPVDRLQTVTGDGWTFVLSDAAGRGLLLRSQAKPDLYLLAEPDLFNTQGVRDLDRARLAVDVVDRLRAGGPVVFDVALNGLVRTRNPAKLAFEPPFLAATLCALAAALLAGWQGAARFGVARPADRELAFGKRALADNSAALLALARREPAMAEPYADLTRQAIARATGVARQLSAQEQVAVIDRMAGGGDSNLARLTAQAARVKDPPALLALARKLYEFRRGMTRERD